MQTPSTASKDSKLSKRSELPTSMSDRLSKPLRSTYRVCSKSLSALNVLYSATCKASFRYDRQLSRI